MAEFGPYQPRQSSRRLWIFAAAVLVVVLAVGVATYFVIRPDPAKNAGKIVGYTPPPTPTSTGSGASSTPRSATLNVTIVRGGRTGCLDAVGCAADNYTAILQSNLGWNLTVDGHKDTGYLAGSKSTPDLSFVPRALAAIKNKPDLFIIEGSPTDSRYDPALIERTAQNLFVKLKQASPGTTIVVTGPIYSGPPPQRISNVEDAIKAAADGRVAKFIDPIAEKWFPTDDPKLIGGDHITPTNAGHVVIATKIEADLAGLTVSGS